MLLLVGLYLFLTHFKQRDDKRRRAQSRAAAARPMPRCTS